jgi:hypothetical protein
MSREATQAYLELIAARARQLAEDYKNSRLWGGELTQGLGEIQATINKIDTSNDR